MPRNRLPGDASAAETDAIALTEEQLSRMAEMIADDRCEFPNDLGSADHERLQTEVRRRLRERLVRLIGRAIAYQLYRDEHPSEAPPHA